MGLANVDTAVDVDTLTDRIEWVEEHDARQHDPSAREPGRRHDPRHRPVHRVRTPSRSSRRRRRRDDRVRRGARVDRVAPAHPRVVPSPTATGSSPPATATRRKIFPESITVVGSGVTGVEFVHMFSSFGAKVTLVVSRQQVLPGKDPEVAAVLEEEFMRRGVKLLKGARAESIERTDDGGRRALRRRPLGDARPTPCSPSARSPTPRASASTRPGSRSTSGATSSSTSTA